MRKRVGEIKKLKQHNMNELDTLIEKKFKELPPENQRALLAYDWKSEVKKISNEKSLTPEQA
jgi:transcriptional regulator with PAS, ATPase and Fis domain